MDEFLVKLKEMLALSESVEALAQDVTNRMLTLIPHKVHAQPGAKVLVSYVARHNIPCAIASSSPPNIIDAMVQAQNWEQVFTVRCSAESEAHGKPAPDVYLTAARQLGIDPARCLALEDSPNGARAAVAAGMTCYTVPDPSHSSPAAFAGITPHVFSDLHAVLAAIKANA
jgi:beta-phosphoglucomutase-like phosphatase (HAD superfamily)